MKKIKLSDYTVSTRKIDKTDLVFRVTMYDHVPMDALRKKNPKQEADHHSKVNFPPFQHFKFDKKGKLKNIRIIKVKKRKKNILVFSRSHGLSKEKILEAKKAVFKKFNANKIIRTGSSIKLCYIADGTANIYPRHGRTMEWDIAAGDAILRYAGGRIKTLDRKIMKYGKPNFKNSSFIDKS